MHFCKFQIFITSAVLTILSFGKQDVLEAVKEDVLFTYIFLKEWILFNYDTTTTYLGLDIKSTKLKSN